MIAGLAIPFLRDPLVLDLDGDGIETISLENSIAHFDYDGNGFSEQTGWISSDDGIVVFDSNGNGRVDGAGELFGSPSQDGFEVLERLDTDNSGQVDVHDLEFSKLLIWRDFDGDGTSDDGELVSLVQADVVSISLSRTDVLGADNGHDLGFQASFMRADDSTGLAQTIYFQVDRQESLLDELSGCYQVS